MSAIPMTPQGEKKLKDELQQLRGVERQQVIAAIAEAREHGDLKENAEYHAARERQGFIEARIRDIESKLSLAQVIDVTQLPRIGKVVFGVTVTILRDDTQARVRYQIVGEEEGDISQGRLSITSPLARALIGKMEDEECDVQTPGGIVTYVIEKIEYLP